MAPNGGKQKGEKDQGQGGQGSGKGQEKASTKNGPSMPRIAQHEAVQTLNYLFQSASYLSAVAGAPPSLAISRARQLVGLSKKATTRLDTSVKRSICRRCRAPLVLEGLTSCVKVKRSGPHGWVKVTRCLACTRKQVVPLGPGFDEKTRRKKALKKREKRRTKAAEKRRRMAEAGEQGAEPETSMKRRSRSEQGEGLEGEEIRARGDEESRRRTSSKEEYRSKEEQQEI
ncbi:hypothetical protein L7F22_011832 [Adiantum nelumboides]|nr:hypothetical protein [Adiantum nelumboides]